jgi:hypothetical protein
VKDGLPCWFLSHWQGGNLSPLITVHNVSAKASQVAFGRMIGSMPFLAEKTLLVVKLDRCWCDEHGPEDLAGCDAWELDLRAVLSLHREGDGASAIVAYGEPVNLKINAEGT